MTQQVLPRSLVIVQFGSLALLAVTGPLIPRTPLWFALALLGMLLGLWALQSMGLGNVNISPEVRPDATLVHRGPYGVIRHPMYAALLLVAIAWVGNDPTLLRVLVLALLTANLLIKMQVEERFLIDYDPAYAHYMKQTRRLIPLLY